MAAAVDSDVESAATSAAAEFQTGHILQVSASSSIILIHFFSCTALLGANGELLWTGCAGRVRWVIHRL